MHVFQTGQTFIEFVAIPGFLQQGAVGIVAVDTLLGKVALIGKVFGKNPVLTPVGVQATQLPAIAVGNDPFRQW